MTVMVPRERWTDERIDKSFDRVDADIRELRVEMKNGFERMDKRFEKVDAKLEAMQSEMTKRFTSLQTESNLRSDAIQRNMATWAIALFSTIVTLNAAVIATISLS